MMSDFDFDCLQRKRLASQSRYKKRGSKSKKCSLSTDYMTPGQWKKRNGEVVTVNLGKPIAWAEFTKLPATMQEEYLRHIQEKYRASGTDIAEMFDVCYATLYRYIKSSGLNISFKKGPSMGGERRLDWLKFLGRIKSADADEETSEAEDSDPAPQDADVSESCEMPEQHRRMEMTHFTLCFSGEIDVGAITNSLLRILGSGNVTGNVKISCDIT